LGGHRPRGLGWDCPVSCPRRLLPLLLPPLLPLLPLLLNLPVASPTTRLRLCLIKHVFIRIVIVA